MNSQINSSVLLQALLRKLNGIYSLKSVHSTQYQLATFKNYKIKYFKLQVLMARKNKIEAASNGNR